MTENDKKLWKEIENCLEYEDDIFYGDSVFVHITSIENLMEWFKNKKTDLLKEFVEFVEDRLTIWIKDENYQANIAEAENDSLRKNTSLLIAETIEAIKNYMKSALEKFLKETTQDEK